MPAAPASTVACPQVRAAALLALVMATAGAAACGGARAPEPGADAAPVAVQGAAVSVVDWPATVEAGGVVIARETAHVASRLLAPVAAVHVRPGDRVRRGQMLVTLDASDLEAEVARARSAAAAAEHGSTAAVADLAGADAALTLARAAHARVAALASQRAATRQELDEAEATLAAAQARRSAATARVAESRAAMDAAAAAERAMAINSSYTTLVAPFDATVVERMVDGGSMAVPGTPLLALERAGGFRLEVRVDASRVTLVQTGQLVSVRLDVAGGAGPWFDGRVVEIARVDPAGHSFGVRIDLPPDPSWRSGLFARARLPGATRRALAVPEAAVLPRGQMHYVFVVAGERARLRAVVAGESAGGRTEILDGVEAGDIVVAPVPASLADGARVSLGVGR